MVARPLRSAAFFDLDKTIIAKSSVLAFGRPFYHGGLINRRAVLRSAYAQFVFALAGADEDQIERMRAYLTSMCAGWDVAQVRDIVSETLHEIIDPIVYDEAVELIGMHKAAGRDVVIVSSSGEEVVGPIGEMLGADHVVATRMVVADGKYTGEIELYAYGAEKAVAVRALAAERHYDLSALLRLLRFGHRRADAGGGRASVRGQRRPCAAPDRRRARLARAHVLQRRPAAAAHLRPAPGAPDAHRHRRRRGDRRRRAVLVRLATPRAAGLRPRTPPGKIRSPRADTPRAPCATGCDRGHSRTRFAAPSMAVQPPAESRSCTASRVPTRAFTPPR